MNTPHWTPEQEALIVEWAGMKPLTELATMLAEIGPARTVKAVELRAQHLNISLARRRRRRWQWSRWTPAEDTLLRELVGKIELAVITTRLNARHGTSRRPNAVRRRLNHLGFSHQVEGLLRAYDIRAILRIPYSEVERLLQSGEIAVEHRPARRLGHWGIRPEALEAYMRAHPERLNAHVMKPGRWRDLALMLTLRSAFLSTSKAMASLGVTHSKLLRLIEDGALPGTVKYGRCWRIPSHSVRALAIKLAGRQPMIERILPLLGTDRWTTAQEIGDQLGVNWKTIAASLQRARRKGMAIESRSSRGYRLASTQDDRRAS